MAKFTLAEVLTLTTGRLLADMDGLYRMLSHMTGDNIFTHQIPRASDECQPWMLRWFPELAAAKAALPLLDEQMGAVSGNDDRKKVIDAWVAKFHESGVMQPEYEVGQIPADDHERKDPITEAAEMMGADRVVVVAPDSH